MSFIAEINPAELVKRLKAVLPRKLMPSDKVTLTADTGYLTASYESTNCIEFAMAIPAKVAKPGAMCVNAQSLLTSMGTLFDHATLVGAPDKYELIVDYGASTSKVYGEDTTPHPLRKTTATWHIAAPEVRRIMQQVVPVRASYDAYSLLGSLCLTLGDQQAEAVATDGSRLVCLTLETPGLNTLLDSKQIVIPGLVLDALEKLKIDGKGCPGLAIGKSEKFSGNFTLTTPSMSIDFKPYPGEYPRYQELFPRPEDAKYDFAVKPADIIPHMKHIARLDKAAKSRLNLARMEFSSTGISIVSGTLGDDDKPLYSATVAGSYPAIKMGFNVYYMQDALAVGDSVVMHGTKELACWIFTPKGDLHTLRHLLMPVQYEAKRAPGSHTSKGNGKRVAADKPAKPVPPRVAAKREAKVPTPTPARVNPAPARSVTPVREIAVASPACQHKRVRYAEGKFVCRDCSTSNPAPVKPVPGECLHKRVKLVGKCVTCRDCGANRS